jgi:hypothetical protein
MSFDVSRNLLLKALVLQSGTGKFLRNLQKSLNEYIWQIEPAVLFVIFTLVTLRLPKIS